MNKKLINFLLDYFYFELNVESVTIVGSLEDKTISEVSDIDIVVVVKKLSKGLFEKIINHAERIDFNQVGIDLKPKINSTFGPLKFDDEESLVLHLMIYDIESHKQHVIASPFTCFDWERSDNYRGKMLKDIYPVIQLMPKDFVNARRGFEDYIQDLEKLVITYREYNFQHKDPALEIKKYPINPIHVTEFCYHIIYNTISNFIKLVLMENVKYFDNEFLIKWSEILPNNHQGYNNLYQNLYYKKKNKLISNEKEISQTKEFLENFYRYELINFISKDNLLIRHMKTEMNDGRFLGRNNNIDIKDNVHEKIDINFSIDNKTHFFSSPLKRCLSTFEKMNIYEFKKSDSLLEIDYGDAEGLFIDDFKKEYPEIFQKWEDKLDEPFPNGENYNMVYQRLFSFLNKHSEYNCIFMTHQGVIRAFVGHCLKIHISDWFLLQIPHFEPIYFVNLKKKFYLNIDRVLLDKILVNYLVN